MDRVVENKERLKYCIPLHMYHSFSCEEEWMVIMAVSPGNEGFDEMSLPALTLARMSQDPFWRASRRQRHTSWPPSPSTSPLAHPYHDNLDTFCSGTTSLPLEFQNGKALMY